MLPQRISPWAHIAEELGAEARKHAEEDVQLGLIFREAQQEAYAAWDAWDEVLGAEIETVHKGSSLQESPQEEVVSQPSIIDRIIRRLLPVEPWTAVASVAFASSASGGISRWVVRIVELGSLRVQPYILINVLEERRGTIISFSVVPLEDPEQPTRPLAPKGGTIEVQLIRPEPKQPIAVTLGGSNSNSFEWNARKSLRDYNQGEEEQWKAEVSLHPSTV